MSILIEGLEDLHLPTRHLGASQVDLALLRTMRWVWVCTSRSRYISRPSPSLLSIRANSEGYLFYPQHLVVAHQALGEQVLRQPSVGALYDLLGPFRFTTRVLNHLKWDVRRENLSWAGAVPDPSLDTALPAIEAELVEASTLKSQAKLAPPQALASPSDETDDDEAIKRAMGI